MKKSSQKFIFFIYSNRYILKKKKKFTWATKRGNSIFGTLLFKNKMWQLVVVPKYKIPLIKIQKLRKLILIVSILLIIDTPLKKN
jgi:hypothetical protein